MSDAPTRFTDESGSDSTQIFPAQVRRWCLPKSYDPRRLAAHMALRIDSDLHVTKRCPHSVTVSTSLRSRICGGG